MFRLEFYASGLKFDNIAKDIYSADLPQEDDWKGSGGTEDRLKGEDLTH